VAERGQAPASGAQRVLILVLDGLGIGAMPDAARYGDEGSHTLGNTARAAGGLRVPVLERLGLGVLADIPGVRPVEGHQAAAGILQSQSTGKDSTTGHWELAGLILSRPFPTYPYGFPPEVMDAFSGAIGRPVLGNVSASGTEIIKRLGEEHVRTGAPIVYTSADSVFQVAAHEDVVPVEQLYAWCQAARRILQGEHGVSRVIARPFSGPAGAFARTPRRSDFSLPPAGPTVLDAIVAEGYPVVGVGKVEDLFAGRGITEAVHTGGDMDGMTRAVEALKTLERGLVLCTLVDLDTVYGHRNDPEGFARHLAAIDGRLPEILDEAGSASLVVITADHGNDPTTPSTDHSREQVPVLAWRAGMAAGVRLGTRCTFADVGATAAAALGVSWSGPGTSFWPALAGGRG
jgi:phosphopentomutase